ncbi:MAG: septation protein A [Gammaproteobacteria bacterium]|nr:septation protein A [Gammaproteobacteria bacterium]
MKLIYDLFPVILFFVTYHQAGVLVDNTPISQMIDISQPEVIVATILATSVAIIASFFQVTGYWLKHRRFEKMHLVSLGLISILGGITIIFGNPAFIQWKPTLLNWVFAAVFLGSQYLGEKNLVQRMMGGQIQLPQPVWVKLNFAWVIFFILSGAANLYVAFYYGLDQDEKTRMDFWVNFKLFGLMGLTFVFVIAQGLYLSKYMTDNQKED